MGDFSKFLSTLSKRTKRWNDQIKDSIQTIPASVAVELHKKMLIRDTDIQALFLDT